MRYMLDTNICIYAIKHKPEQVFKRLQEHDPSEICISSVTHYNYYNCIINGNERKCYPFLCVVCREMKKVGRFRSARLFYEV